AARGEVAHDELGISLAAGRTGTFEATFSPLRDASGAVRQIVLSGVEISARKAAEESLVAVNRSLRVLSACDAALTRATDETELLQRICTLLVDLGGYRFVWVGYAEHDAEKRVRPVAHAGHDAGYLAQLKVSWDESPHGNGPTGRAIRTGQPQCARRIDRQAGFEPWRSACLARGYASSLAIPLTLGEARIGALSIYSGTAEAFGEAEVTLLCQLAADLAYGIEALRTRAHHDRAEHQLHTFRALLDRTNDLVYVVDAASGRILDVNEAVVRRLGYSREELLGMRLVDISVRVDARSWDASIERLRASGSAVIVAEHRCKSGELLPVEASLSYVEHEGQRYLVDVARDITERQVIARLGRVLRMQSAINAALLRIADRDELLQEACRIATEVGGYDRAVLSLVNADGRSATPSFSSGTGTDFPIPAVLPIAAGDEPDESLTSRALRTGEVAISSDVTRSEPPVAMRETLIRTGFRSLVALPLIVEGAKVGALMLASRDPDRVRDEELLLLQDITQSLAFALRSQRQASVARFLEAFNPLTGLARRALFCQRVDRLLRDRVGADRHPAVAVLDIHQLSHINDSFGRRFGDLLLQSIAERLRSTVPSDDYLGSLGGGSFALLHVGIAPSEESIDSFLESAVFGEPFSVEGRTLRVACRSGAARFPEDGHDCSTLLQKAEAALRHAKETGERYLHYRMQMHSELVERLSLEHRLHAALDEQQFELYYQPQISLTSGRIESVEALLRWNDPERGLVTPAAFLPVLESSGLIVPVGQWVFERALRDCASWQALGRAPTRVAVNVSALQLQRRDFVPRLLELFARAPPAAAGFGIDLEITETALLQDLEATSRKLRELRAAGARIALDDFGTGYSSLGLLSKLPVDSLKIDRSFITGLPNDAASVSLTSSIIGLALALGLVTVAEGVETQAQLELLKVMRCDQSQGYLHGRPMDAQRMAALLPAA
ncbi:MAG TPA: EAL domain-containing protein, partial [Myxococcales bacterium]|nr:EAL domain-containing protein [Myxococcales bacterium]